MSIGNNTPPDPEDQAKDISVSGDNPQALTTTNVQTRAVDVRLDKAVATRFLTELLRPGVGCIEIRIFNAEIKNNGFFKKADRFTKTLAGYFKDASQATSALWYAGEVSVYVTVNPVLPALLGRENGGSIKVVKTGESTSDHQIVDLRNIFIDIDAVHVSGISATDEEMAGAIEVRNRILDEHPAIRAASWWGCSGNGGWILVNIGGLRNDSDHNRLVERFLATLGVRYSIADRVKIDQATKNASRIMCVPGTRKRKGSPLPDRPHRLATLDSDEAHVRETFDLAGWLAENDKVAIPDPRPEVKPSASARMMALDQVRDDPSDVEVLADALDQIRKMADDYVSWLNVEMALCALGERGLSLWDDWSRSSDKHVPGECAKKWRTFEAGGGLGVGSIFHGS